MATGGWPASTADLYLPCDSIGWLDPAGRLQMHTVTAVAGSASDGAAVASISPPIRRSPTAGTPLLAEPSQVWRPAEDAPHIRHLPSQMVEFRLNLEETLW